MGIFFDTAVILGIRLLRLDGDAWFAVKEHIGQDYQQIEREFESYVGNTGYRIEYAHPATTTLEVGGSQMLIWQ